MITKNLKTSTKQLHAETEKAMNAKRIFAPSFQISEYIEILQALYLAHQQIENQLEKVDDPGFRSLMEKHYSPRLNLIRKDLENLNAEIPSGTEDSIRLNGHFEAYGALYVLKGSTLGGKFIYKHLEKTTADWPLSSLEFYGYEHEGVMENWTAYCEDFDALEFSPAHEDLIIEGAQKTFNTFIEVSFQQSSR